MKRVISLFVLLFAATLTIQAQTTENRSVGSFHGIKSSQGIDVYLHKGTTHAVKIEAENIDMDDIRTVVDGGILKISLEKGNYRNVDVTVEVTFTTLDMIAASSASGVFGSDVIQGRQLEIYASSAASIEVEVDVQELNVEVSSAADVEVSGKAKTARIDASSAGEADTYDLKAMRVHVQAASAGEAKVYAEEEILAQASSGGSVRYKGDPQKSSTDSRSGGSVRKTN